MTAGRDRLRRAAAVIGLCLILTLCACGEEPELAAPPAEETAPPAPAQTAGEESSEEGGSAMLQLSIGETAVAVTWEENESVQALCRLCREEPLTIPLSMYGGFEQVGPIGASLPRSDTQTTTAAGDIVLYAGNQIVLFYGSNSWAYTRLGHIADRSAEELTELLGQGDVEITLDWEDGT